MKVIDSRPDPVFVKAGPAIRTVELGIGESQQHQEVAVCERVHSQRRRAGVNSSLMLTRLLMRPLWRIWG